jgi:hypothetical protein
MSGKKRISEIWLQADGKFKSHRQITQITKCGLIVGDFRVLTNLACLGVVPVGWSAPPRKREQRQVMPGDVKLIKHSQTFQYLL